MKLCQTCKFNKVKQNEIDCSSCEDNEYTHRGWEWQVLHYLRENELHFSSRDTSLPCAKQLSGHARRADFTFELPDRYVFLEVDENEHRYNSPECERKREQQLADSVPAGKYVVMVRYNPMPRGVPFLKNLERMGDKLREAFTTDDVQLAEDGIHRIYVGYTRQKVRHLGAEYEKVQRKALKDDRTNEAALVETSKKLKTDHTNETALVETS